MAAAAFDKAMGVAQMFIGRSLQHDIIEPLGSQWAIYNDASIPRRDIYHAGRMAAIDRQRRQHGRGQQARSIRPRPLQGWKMMSYAINNALVTFHAAIGFSNLHCDDAEQRRSGLHRQHAVRAAFVDNS